MGDSRIWALGGAAVLLLVAGGVAMMVPAGLPVASVVTGPEPAASASAADTPPPAVSSPVAPASPEVEPKAPAPQAPAEPGKALPVSALYGLSGPPPPAPPADGGPPDQIWSVQIGLYVSAGEASRVRAVLAHARQDAQVVTWSDQRGQTWYTVKIPETSASAAANVALMVRRYGWVPVRVSPPYSIPATKSPAAGG